MNINKKAYLLISILLMGLQLHCGIDTNVEKTEENKRLESASYSKDTVELSKIVETINLIQEVHVGADGYNKEDFYEAALAGLVKSLEDPYSEYLDAEELKSMNEDLDGEYSGLGISIRKQKGELIEIISPFIGGPAFKVGIQIGDKISEIEGEKVDPLTATEVSKRLRGKKGTSVNIEIIRKGKKDPIKLNITRDIIKLEQVESKMLSSDIGYLSLTQFGNNVGHKIEKELKKLKAQGMKKLIFDLRTNPGGSLAEAVDISSLFNKEEFIVSLKYKDNEEQKYYRTLDYMGDFPMVVLVNKGSASASEIVTGVIKDYKRATIIGETTYGKGVAQRIFNYKSGDAVKLTIAEYSTPKNHNINKNGIEPDIYIKQNEILSSKGYANETKEAKANRIKELEKILIESEGKEKANEIIKKGDVQLQAAIDVLNGKKVESDKKEVK